MMMGVTSYHQRLPQVNAESGAAGWERVMGIGMEEVFFMEMAEWEADGAGTGSTTAAQAKS